MARNKMLRIRVTDEEKQSIESRAQELGLNVSEYFRLLYLKDIKKIGGKTNG